ncbi:MAG: response regulator [Methanomicrobiaceae archaeon]|nr:response regulator [Methanomicrobiaceae archaeon]
MSGSKVLIVEDEVIVAMSIERTLSSFGYDITGLSTTPEDAIRMAGELKPDLILMDINLDGEIDGIDAAEKITEMLDIPVVYLTSYTNEETLRRAIGTNPYGYLTKPVRPKEIYTTIETALNKHRANLAEKKLREIQKTQWEILNSIDLGLCIADYDPKDGRCTLKAINDKACGILGVSGRDLWRRCADLDEFIPGVGPGVSCCISEGKKRIILSCGNLGNPENAAEPGYVIRVTGFNGHYSVFITFIDPDESSGTVETPETPGLSDMKIYREYAGIGIMREHISSILSLCKEGDVSAERISAHALEIEKVLKDLC